MMIPRSFVFYHTTPQENQISGKYHSFTSKWQSLERPDARWGGRGMYEEIKSSRDPRDHVEDG